MSADGSIELAWGDGEDIFRLALGQLRILQEKCKAGPNTIRLRLLSGEWYVDDIRETIRLGLIGGGAKPAAAQEKVQRSVDAQPLADNVMLAAAILAAAIVGAPDDPVGKALAEEGAPETTMVSSSPPSMDQAQS
jgi:hypothetical protein